MDTTRAKRYDNQNKNVTKKSFAGFHFSRRLSGSVVNQVLFFYRPSPAFQVLPQGEDSSAKIGQSAAATAEERLSYRGAPRQGRIRTDLLSSAKVSLGLVGLQYCRECGSFGINPCA